MHEMELDFDSYDGLNLHGTFSAARQTRGAALLLHGIKGDRNSWGLYPRLASVLAETGIPSFRFDYRCHGTDNTPFSQFTIAGVYNDIEAAFQKLKEHTGVGKPITLIAASFSGGIALEWASKKAKEIDALYLLAPVLDYEHFMLVARELKTGNSLTPIAKEQLHQLNYLTSYEGVSISRALINEIPVINTVSAARYLNRPVHILHGTLDEAVPIRQSEMFAELVPNSILHRLSRMKHGFATPSDDSFVHPLTVANQVKVCEMICSMIVEAEEAGISSQELWLK